MAISRPADHGLPFLSWSPAKLADLQVAEGVIADVSTRGSAVCYRMKGCPFQRVKTYKASTDPAFESKKNRVLELYAIANGITKPGFDDPEAVICVGAGPSNLQPHPGRQWAERGGGGARPRRCRRATYTRPHGVRHVFDAYDRARDRFGVSWQVIPPGMIDLLTHPDPGVQSRAHAAMMGQRRLDVAAI